MCFLLIPSAGCKTRIVAMADDREVVRMPASTPYTPAAPGWFVPDARMQEILTELNKK